MPPPSSKRSTAPFGTYLWFREVEEAAMLEAWQEPPPKQPQSKPELADDDRRQGKR